MNLLPQVFHSFLTVSFLLEALYILLSHVSNESADKGEKSLSKIDLPLITAIMPLKGYKEEFLREALQSLFDQTCSEWRLIIVVEELDHTHFFKLLQTDLEDSRVEMVIMEGNPFSGSINTGMRYAATKFVALLFADDLWTSDAVEILKANIQHNPSVDFFHSSRIIINELGKPISSLMLSKEQFTQDDFKWGSPVKHLLCWRKEKGLAVGGLDETLLKAEDDYDFPWTMAEHHAEFKAIKECLYYHRNHCQCYRKTTHIPLSVGRRNVLKILKKHGVGFLQRQFITNKNRLKGGLGAQSIYRNTLDRWVKGKLGIDAKKSWKQIVYK